MKIHITLSLDLRREPTNPPEEEEPYRETDTDSSTELSHQRIGFRPPSEEEE